MAVTAGVKGRAGVERTRQVARAALACFINGGYRLTQIAHVSERLGVSIGSIYRYVESKEALFHIAALEAVGWLPDDIELPVKVSGLGETVAVIRDAATRTQLWPRLLAAADAPGAPDAEAEARSIAGELFDLVSLRADLICLLDRCAQDVPELVEVFDDHVRRRYFGDLLRWVSRRGLVPKGGGLDEYALTRGALEAVVWLGQKRVGDATATAITDDQARAAAVRIFASAFDYRAR
ncbi:MAG: TetR/AcrR family transcriptional regulator [Caulobacterales bacterium]